MSNRNRRVFLGEVGQGMLAALIGPALAAEMGLTSVALADAPAGQTPEAMERLVGLLQETPVEKLVPTVLGELNKGITLRQLVAAGALSNARAFGGHNYDGYHTFMAMAPAFAMAQELPEKQRAIPILKVLHRNSRTMSSGPGKKVDRLPAVQPATLNGQPVGKMLVEAIRARKTQEADQILVAAAQKSLPDAYDELQDIVHEDMNVHRVVLAWRSWETIDFTGEAHARTLLRQSVHFCVDESNRVNPIRTVLPQLMEKYRLMEKPIGQKTADDAWVNQLSQTIFGMNRESAAEAVAAALSEGYSPDVVGEAMSLACARLVLGDPGRAKSDGGDKLIGTVHGASVGVHASDSANAWRHIARVTKPRNTFASLVAGAYHTAGQSTRHLKDLYPQAADLEPIREKDPGTLLKLTEEAIRAKDQRRTSALAHQYGTQGHDAKALFALLRRFAISEDGALHAEKYYRTVSEEFATLRPSFRWQHLVALARVTSSLYGSPAPGMEEVQKVLG